MSFIGNADSPASMAEDPKLLFAMVSALPDDLPHKRRLLSICGDVFLDCFRDTGDKEEINNSILAYEHAIQHTYHDSQTSDDRVMAALQSRLGTSFLSRFKLTRDLNDISEAITAQKKAIDLTPMDHADMPRHLGNVGTTFMCRFEHTGNLEDLDQAKSAYQKAVLLTPEGHPDLPRHLNNLGISFRSHFQRTGNVEDLDQAMLVLQKAILLTHYGHADRPGLLSDFGTSMLCRFEQSGNIADLSEAISIQKEAITLTPDGHVDLPGRWSDLGTSLMRRFERTNNAKDIDEAISIQQMAIDLIPDDHADMPGRLSNLGMSYTCRFEHIGDLSDIDKAISLQQNAVHLIPAAHPDMARQLSNLAAAFRCRFERTGDIADIHSAISSYQQVATHSSGPLSIRLEAAKNWTKWSQKFDPSQLLGAYEAAIEIVSRIGVGAYTPRRHHANLVDISDLSTAAAAAAFLFGRFDTALEWLEQGRSLIWRQFGLRTPLDDLQAFDPALADHFLQISRNIETSSRSLRESVFISNMEKNTLLQEEIAHVKLIQQWDEILNTVRGLPGFEGFLRPVSCSNLLSSIPETGPVVIINVHEARCDALALISGNENPLHIPLVNFSYKQADDLRSRLKVYLSSRDIFPTRGTKSVESGMNQHQNARVIREILGELWVHVVKPVLDGLNFSVSQIIYSRGHDID